MIRLTFALLACAAIAQPQLTPEEKKEGYVLLFDGKTLNGWDGDPRLWKVRDGAIIGNTDGIELSHNTFLISKRTYGDFVLRVETKLRNHNSGIQFRSTAFPDWVVKGLQADMADNNWWGGVYDEGGKRGVMVNGWKGKAETVVKKDGWNTYEVYCKGDLIQLRVNGLLTAELHDSVKMEGVFGLQLHRGPGMEVAFRNLRIKELK